MAAFNTNLTCLSSLESIALDGDAADGIAVDALRDQGLIVLVDHAWSLTDLGRDRLRDLRATLSFAAPAS